MNIVPTFSPPEAPFGASPRKDRPMPSQTEVDRIHRRLQSLRGSLFHGTPHHREASARLRKQAATLLTADPLGPFSASLGSTVEMLDTQAATWRRAGNPRAVA